MLEWFIALSSENKVAIVVASISVGGVVLGAIINGIFSIISKNKDTKYTIKQKGYDNATQIGIQINKEEEAK